MNEVTNRSIYAECVCVAFIMVVSVILVIVCIWLATIRA